MTWLTYSGIQILPEYLRKAIWEQNYFQEFQKDTDSPKLTVTKQLNLLVLKAFFRISIPVHLKLVIE